MNIKIYKKNFDLTEPFRQYLQDKFKVVEKYQKNIISFVIELSRDQHHNKGEVFTVAVHVSLPNKQNIILKETSSDARAAVDDVQEKLIRQLVKYKEKNISKIRKNIRRFKSLKFWQKN
ncbi:ribosome-associated translation inhibitor RaiA [bacterium]|jgi:putative sigma-54 modulation protein|nr:ribosome-associated translation inhibitor RaiA [bacterium]MBT4649241.1 ribosome-associated translation inhibitor RaiA [bacterium]